MTTTTKHARTKSIAAKKPDAPAKAAAAYESIYDEAKKLAPDALAPVNVNIPQAVSMVLGAIPQLATFRAQIVEQLPKHPVKLLDRLETYALGAWYAYLLATPVDATSELKTLDEEAIPLRENLLSDAEALAKRGLLDATHVADIRSGVGQIDRANDLVALSALFAANWSTVQGKTVATLDEVHRAGELGPLLLAAIGAKDRPPARTDGADPADIRARMFTLFSSAYDACRRAVGYLRWDEGDADVVAPSLHATRTGHRAHAAQPPAAPPPPANGGAPASPPKT